MGALWTITKIHALEREVKELKERIEKLDDALSRHAVSTTHHPSLVGLNRLIDKIYEGDEGK